MGVEEGTGWWFCAANYEEAWLKIYGGLDLGRYVLFSLALFAVLAWLGNYVYGGVWRTGMAK